MIHDKMAWNLLYLYSWNTWYYCAQIISVHHRDKRPCWCDWNDFWFQLIIPLPFTHFLQSIPDLLAQEHISTDFLLHSNKAQHYKALNLHFPVIFLLNSLTNTWQTHHIALVFTFTWQFYPKRLTVNSTYIWNIWSVLCVHSLDLEHLTEHLLKLLITEHNASEKLKSLLDSLKSENIPFFPIKFINSSRIYSAVSHRSLCHRGGAHVAHKYHNTHRGFISTRRHSVNELFLINHTFLSHKRIRERFDFKLKKTIRVFETIFKSSAWGTNLWPESTFFCPASYDPMRVWHHEKVTWSKMFESIWKNRLNISVSLFLHFADSLVAPVNVSIKDLKSSSALLTWDTPDGESVIGFAITQQVHGEKERENISLSNK